MLAFTWFELKRNTIHAITKTSRLGAIVENVPKLTTAAAAMHLRTDQEKEAAVL
jgi:hypothetical protein